MTCDYNTGSLSLLIPNLLVGCGKAERHSRMSPFPARRMGISLFKAAYMASKYWLKLYHEILDDPKMGVMSDRLWRRAIETFLLAGENDDEGFLPSLDDMAWRLRLTSEELESDLVELAKCGVVSQTDGLWLVTRFKERQSKVSGAERTRRYRERKRKDELVELPHEDETQEKRTCDESSQKSARDTDKIRIDKDIDIDNSQIEDFVIVGFSELNIGPKEIREFIDKHDPYYLQEKIRAYRYRLKRFPSTKTGWLINSIRENWDFPSGYEHDSNNPWVIQQKYGKYAEQPD